MRIRGGMGIGDALYVRPVAEYFVRQGHPVQVLSAHPEIFEGSGASVLPFSRTNVQVLAHYTTGKGDPSTTQWQDVCRSAGIKERLPLRFDWTVKNRSLLNTMSVLAAGRPLILVHGGREPMGRTDGFGMELLPERRAFDAVLAELRGCFLVRIGQAPQLYPLTVDMDLNGSTSKSDLLDLATACDGIVAQCSFAVPLAEVFEKPLLAVWAARGLASNTQFIRQITPKKILHGSQSRFVVDDWDEAKIRSVTREVFVV